jgi:hypothetical protein
MTAYTSFCTLLDPKALNSMHQNDKLSENHTFCLSDNQPHTTLKKCYFGGGGGERCERREIHTFVSWSNQEKRTHMEDLGQIGQ